MKGSSGRAIKSTVLAYGAVSEVVAIRNSGIRNCSDRRGARNGILTSVIKYRLHIMRSARNGMRKIPLEVWRNVDMEVVDVYVCGRT